MLYLLQLMLQLLNLNKIFLLNELIFLVVLSYRKFEIVELYQFLQVQFFGYVEHELQILVLLQIHYELVEQLLYVLVLFFRLQK